MSCWVGMGKTEVDIWVVDKELRMKSDGTNDNFKFWMENELTTSKKNTFRLPFLGTAVELSGDFDSGNLNSVSI